MSEPVATPAVPVEETKVETPAAEPTPAPEPAVEAPAAEAPKEEPKTAEAAPAAEAPATEAAAADAPKVEEAPAATEEAKPAEPAATETKKEERPKSPSILAKLLAPKFKGEKKEKAEKKPKEKAAKKTEKKEEKKEEAALAEEAPKEPAAEAPAVEEAQPRPPNSFQIRRYLLIPLFLIALSTHIINFYWDWSTRHSDTHTNTPASTISTILPDFSHLASHCAHISPISSSSFLLRQDALAQTLYALNAAAYIAEPGASAGFFGNVSSSHWGLSERPLLLLIQPQTDDAGAVHANVAFETTRAKMLPIPSEGGVTYTAWAEDADPYATALALVPSLENATIFVDGDVRMFVADGLQRAAQRARVTSTPVEVKRLRERKSSEELDIMKCVNEVTLLAIRAARQHMKIGMRESEARQLIESALTAAGLKGGFALTLFGENAALPHGHGTDRVLREDEYIIIDCGGTLHGYHSNVTRTFALEESKISLNHQEIWHIVRRAQRQAIQEARNGTVTAAVDHTARSLITEEGYGKYFTHRLGHGIGLETHESPYLRGGSDDLILTGQTLFDELGIYIEGEVGVRLEDCFYIDTDGSAVFLTEQVGGQATSPWYP